jgi:surface antigen
MRRRRRRAGGIAGIVLVVVSLLSGLLGAAYGVAREIGDKIECHAFQLIAKEILARGGPGATTIQDLGDQDLCQEPYSMAQAMCQDLLDLDVCSLKQLVSERICPAIDLCSAVSDWFLDTKVAAQTWLVTRLKAPAEWLMDHARLAWGSVSAAMRGSQAAADGDGSPGATDAQASDPGSELDSEIVQEEGGGDPGAAPNDGVPGLEAPETATDLEAGEADCGSTCTATEAASDDPDLRDTTVLDAVDAAEATAEKAGTIATALKVVGKILGVGLKVAGWVGIALMAVEFVSDIIGTLSAGVQVAPQDQAGGFHDYSPEDLWYPNYSSCSARYDTWAEVLQDPTSLANVQFINEIGGNNDVQGQISSYTDSLFMANTFLQAANDALTGGLLPLSVTSDDISFLPPQTMSLFTMDEAATSGGFADDCPGPAPAASASDQAVIQAAYVRDLDVAGYDGAYLVAHPADLASEGVQTPGGWCYPAGYATVQDLQSVLVPDGAWGQIAQVLSGQAYCGTEAQPTTPVAYPQLVDDLKAGNDGLYDQLLSEATVVEASGDLAADQSTPGGTIAGDAALAVGALKAIPQAIGATVTQAAQDPAGPASPMSEDDAISLLLATSDVLGSGDPTQVATSYVETDPTSSGDSGALIGGAGGNIGSTALLASQMVTGYAQASPQGTLDPSSADDQYLATAADLADDLSDSGGDLNSAYATYVSQNHLPPYAGAWSGGYPTSPAAAPSDINQGSELNAGDWGLEAGAYQGGPPAVPTAYLLTLSASDWEAWLDASDLGNNAVQPPQDLLLGQPMPPADLLAIFEAAAQTYDTSLPLLLAVSAQQSGFTQLCEPVGTPQEQEGSDVGVMGMAPGAFSATKPPPGLDMTATASAADSVPLTLDGRTWARSDALPGSEDGTCPLLGEEAGMLDPTAEIDVAAFLLNQDGATADADGDQLQQAAIAFWEQGVTTAGGTGATFASSWAQSVVVIRYPAYADWLSGGAPQTGSAGCSGPIGTICPEPATPVFPWVPPAGYPDGFPAGQCTYWAAYNSWAVSAYGIGGDADGPGSDSWIVSAQARMPAGSVLVAGSPDAIPQVGDIVVYLPGGDYNATLGHVAVVVAVDVDPAAPQGISGYWISEMNVIGLGKVDERHIAWPDPQVRGFILAMPPEVGD